MYRCDSIIIGFAKFGQKDLYFYDKSGKIWPKTCMCLLDFFVEEQSQRGGIGLAMMLKVLEVD